MITTDRRGVQYLKQDPTCYYEVQTIQYGIGRYGYNHIIWLMLNIISFNEHDGSDFLSANITLMFCIGADIFITIAEIGSYFSIKGNIQVGYDL